MIGLAEVDGAWDAGFVTGALIGAVIAIVALKWEAVCDFLLGVLDEPEQPPTPPRPTLRLIHRPFDWERDSAA